MQVTTVDFSVFNREAGEKIAAYINEKKTFMDFHAFVASYPCRKR